jgi:hypothetical protein
MASPNVLIDQSKSDSDSTKTQISHISESDAKDLEGKSLFITE